MWGVMTVVLGGWVGAAPQASGAPAVSAVAPGAVLPLPRPRALPCQRFPSALAAAMDGHGRQPSQGKEEDISVEWMVGSRRYRVGTDASPAPMPLPAAALPRSIALVSRRPHDQISLVLSCNDDPDLASDRYDNERFVGIAWLCTAVGCRVEAGYPLPARLVRSPRRLRLCSTPREPDARRSGLCDRRHRDVRPAFVDAGGAMALARDILADARRTTEDVCQVAGGCRAWVRAAVAAVGPASWRATSWRVWPRDEPSRGDEGMQLTVAAGARTLNLECVARPLGDMQGCWLEARDGEGKRLFKYQPIDDDIIPEARFERSSGDDIALSADPEHQIPPACSLSSDALRAR